MKKSARLLFSVAFVVFLHAQGAFPGTTGKIRGLVIDASSGDPLPGVNVVVTGVWDNNIEKKFDESLGAATRMDGEFIILKVPPGIYSLTASMMGYASEIQQRIHVNVDRTSNTKFALKETILDVGKELVVEATRDLVQIDVAATENYITKEDYNATPFANRIEDVIGLQSGISGNIIEDKISIRAGDTREVGFLLDGMSMYDEKYSRPVISIQPGIVQEIKIMRNGFNAEYGQSRSGMINVVTKNPAAQVHFSVDYQIEPAKRRHYGRDKYDINWNLWRLYAGPKAFAGDTLVTPDGLYDKEQTWIGWDKYAQRLLGDNNPDNDLTAEEAYELWKWRHRPIKYGNLAGHNLDLTLSGRVPLLPWKANVLLGGKYEYHPFTYPQSTNHYDEKITSLKMVNTLSDNSKLTVNGLYSLVHSVAQSTVGNGLWDDHPLGVSYSGGGFSSYYPFDKPLVDRNTYLIGLKFVQTISPTLYYELNLNNFYINWKAKPPEAARPEDGRYFHDRLYYDPQSGWISKDNGVDDEVSGYRMYGGATAWENSMNRRYSLSGFVVNQFHPAHELKAGFEFNYNFLRDDRVRWPNEDSTQASFRKFKVKPFDMSAYLQDKIEFQGMIANVGLRFDYLNINTDRPDIRNVLGYADDREVWDTYWSGNFPMYRPKPKYYFSPRIGISHPLTDRSKIYFNYGHFIQSPPAYNLYVEYAASSEHKMVQMGNPELTFEKTIAYELGGDFSLSDFFQLHIGAFYKDNSDILGTMTFLHIDQRLWMDWWDNYKYEEIRGFEIELRKSVGRFISGWVNYNYIKKSRANYRIEHLGADPLVTDDLSRGVNGLIWGVPRSNIDLIQPNARGVITFSTPPEWGPKFHNLALLSDTQLSFRVFYAGGPQRRHPDKSFQDKHPDVWFKELDRYWADMRINKRFRINSFDFEIFMDVSNVVHTKFRYVPGSALGSNKDYYYDLWESGRLNQVGTDKLTNPKILRTENDDVYWARFKNYIFGLRINL